MLRSCQHSLCTPTSRKCVRSPNLGALTTGYSLPLSLHSSVAQHHTVLAVKESPAAAYASYYLNVRTRFLVVASAAADGAEDAAAQNTASTSGRFSEVEVQQLWDSVSRALLKLGKTGVTETHARSLSELVASHKLVKVQHNGARGDPAVIAAAAAELQDQSSGAVELLHVKGSTMLFASSSLTNEQLTAVAEAETAATTVWKTKRAAAAEQRRQQREVVEAKKVSSASRSRKRIGQLISAVAKPSKGPLDKGTLVQEWQQLASTIAAEEAGAEGGEQQRKSKSPWKK